MRFLPDVHHIDWHHDLTAAVTIVVLPAVILFGTSGRLFLFAVVAMAVLVVPGRVPVRAA